VSLADELSGEDTRQRSCKLCSILNEMEDGRDKDALVTALQDPLVTSTRIQRALTNAGHSISETPVYRHRRNNHVSSR